MTATVAAVGVAVSVWFDANAITDVGGDSDEGINKFAGFFDNTAEAAASFSLSLINMVGDGGGVVLADDDIVVIVVVTVDVVDAEQS